MSRGRSPAFPVFCNPAWFSTTTGRIKEIPYLKKCPFKLTRLRPANKHYEMQRQSERPMIRFYLTGVKSATEKYQWFLSKLNARTYVKKVFRVKTVNISKKNDFSMKLCFLLKTLFNPQPRYRRGT